MFFNTFLYVAVISFIFYFLYLFIQNDVILRETAGLDIGVPTTTLSNGFLALAAQQLNAQSSFGQYLFFADVYKRTEIERLIVVRPINWYVYSNNDHFYLLTYVAGHRCLPTQCSTINLQSIANWRNEKSRLVHGCLNISQIELLSIFAPCNFYVEHYRVSLDKFFENSDDQSLTIIEILNYLLENEKL